MVTARGLFSIQINTEHFEMVVTSFGLLSLAQLLSSSGCGGFNVVENGNHLTAL